jgi:hypothetical protein
MTARTRDIVTGAILLALSVAWSTTVLLTIPPGQGGGDIGPRAFPLWLGVFLGAMAILMILRNLSLKAASPETDASGTKPAPRASAREQRQELVYIALTAGLLALYGLALPVIGFNLATVMIVLLALWLCVHERSVKILAGMTIGIPLTVWLIFGKILQIPLATGSWINLG